MKLGIGTAQWGTSYGVSNVHGMASHADIQSILTMAKENGIQVLDTAFQYGRSEERIGESLPPTHSFHIVTKAQAFKTAKITHDHVVRFLDTFRLSLKHLKQTSTYGLLIHHTPDILTDSENLLWKSLESLKADGFVKKIGISIYTGEELEQALTKVKPDIVQLPFNILDQRLLKRGQLARLKDMNVEIHARSVFLQGLLLMQEQERPAFFKPWQSELRHCHDVLKTVGLSPLEGALQFALQNPYIDCVLVGAANAAEFKRVVTAAALNTPISLDWECVASNDEVLLNPSRWSVNAS